MSCAKLQKNITGCLQITFTAFNLWKLKNSVKKCVFWFLVTDSLHRIDQVFKGRRHVFLTRKETCAPTLTIRWCEGFGILAFCNSLGKSLVTGNLIGVNHRSTEASLNFHRWQDLACNFQNANCLECFLPASGKNLERVLQTTEWGCLHFMSAFYV